MGMNKACKTITSLPYCALIFMTYGFVHISKMQTMKIITWKCSSQGSKQWHDFCRGNRLWSTPFPHLLDLTTTRLTSVKVSPYEKKNIN